MNILPSINFKIDVKPLLVVVLFICFHWGCNRVPPEYETFLEHPLKQQQEELRRLPHDKQLDYYFAGINYTHPPAFGLAHPIAEQGKAVLPFLLESLKEEKDERKKSGIIFILKIMHSNYYDLKGEKEAINLIKDTTGYAISQDLKREGREALDFILEGKLPDPVKLLDQREEETR